ncbi:MAG: STAS domain-containing protein [Armatimonadota bacterium]
MNLSVTKSGDIAIVEIPGDHLDAGNVKEFKREITQVLNDNKKVVFDFGQLRFVDSSGLGAILSSLRTLNAAGGDLKLAALSKGVRALFELVRMHRIFDIFNTVDEAVKAF